MDKKVTFMLCVFNHKKLKKKNQQKQEWKLVVIVHTCNSSTWEAEAGGL
jgi:hypothetical protein